MKGAKRTPSAIKDLRGTTRADRTNPDEPKPEVIRLEAPEWLSPRAKEAFEELAKLFYTQKILTNMDSMALTLLCDQWADYREARDFIEQNGQYTVGLDKMGNEVYKNYPQMATKATAYNNIMRMLTEFGATPASRSKVKATDAGEPDPLDEYLKMVAERRSN